MIFSSNDSPLSGFAGFSGGAFLWVIASWLLTAIVHIAFAWAVLMDADLLWRSRRSTTFLVGGALWALATLLGGVFVAGVYWAIHHSALRPPRPEVPPEPAGTKPESY